MVFNTVKKNLEDKGYTVSCFDNSKDACEYLNSKIDGMTVGHGGSMTLAEMGVCQALATHNAVYGHQTTMASDDREKIIFEANNADIYLSSVNGLSEDGQIINIDGNCNRVASILYGHKKVYFIVGKNKLAPDYDSALFRARNIAAPLNAKRLKRNTPCAAKGDRCYDCNSTERICRALTVFYTKPRGQDYEVVLINEDLGY